MIKKLVCLTLCLCMLATVFAGCSNKDDKYYDGAYVTMYIADEMYDFDPANAYNNESALKIVSLLFDNLFVLNEKGKAEKSLAKKYEIIENKDLDEYKMRITLKETKWTDGTALTANDVVFAWTRLLKPDSSYEAASLLFDIKNARAAKNGETSIDNVQILAAESDVVEIEFEGKIDYDQFILNLTSYALVPLREDVVRKTSDWAKQPSTICSSGPFRIREISYDEGEESLVLERNSYYFRNALKDKVDKSVTPYRLIIDYSMSDSEIVKAYDQGKLFYIGDIPLSIRGSVVGAEVSDIMKSMSTHTYYLNENAVIRYYNEDAFKKLSTENYNEKLVAKLVEGKDGEKILANANVRQALSLVINRSAIAQKVVYAQAASGFIPYGVFNADSAKKSFREEGGALIPTAANKSSAETKIKESGIDPTKFMFTISVPEYDDVHMMIAKEVQAAWSSLGFHVAINAIKTEVNDDKNASTGEVSKIIRDDIFAEKFRAGLYEVAAIDKVAPSVDAFASLAPFAYGFTGNASSAKNSPEFNIPKHSTGYSNKTYDELIKAAYEEKNINKRADILHQAEQILVKDMPVIPIIFNQNAKFVSSELSKITTDYYSLDRFTKMELKDYKLYLPADVIEEINDEMSRDAAMAEKATDTSSKNSKTTETTAAATTK